MDIREWRGDERPAQDEPVASVLRAAAAPSEPGPQPGEEAALAAFRATHQTLGRTPMRSTRMKAAFAAAVSAGVLLTGGIAAAAVTGTLPGAAHVGISPDHATGGEHANEHADTRGVSDQHVGQHEATDPTDESTEPTDTEKASTETGDEQANQDATEPQDQSADGEDAAPAHPDNHGGAVSETAKDHSLQGRDHGQAVSSTARSDAGKTHAKSGDSADHKPADAGTERSDTGKQASAAKGDNARSGTDDEARSGRLHSAHSGAKAHTRATR